MYPAAATSMQRVDADEILDSDGCSAREIQNVLTVLGRINRWFGGVATTRKMVERVAQATGAKHFSLLEVAAGLGEVPEEVCAKVAPSGITLDLTLVDRAQSHLPDRHSANRDRTSAKQGIVADALSLPFADGAFDLVSCSLFAHHLNSQQLAEFAREGLRVSRRALLINDLIRHPLHLALVYASYPIMCNRVAWLDGLTSVRRSYVPDEIRAMLAATFSPEVRSEISCNYLYRMGVIVWKEGEDVALWRRG
ncbi:MAG TPA: methyltransferase domain-containing protein [Candidatus Acidoferrum sp.]|nr:methyltransferase domain-containing protein [Candidatus Acidoferrum sp.]